LYLEGYWTKLGVDLTNITETTDQLCRIALAFEMKVFSGAYIGYQTSFFKEAPINNYLRR